MKSPFLSKVNTYFNRVLFRPTVSAPQAEIEPRVGGKYELFWEPEDRDSNSTIGCRITALARDQFLSFQWRSPKQYKRFANTEDPLTHAAVMFFPDGKGTRIQMAHSGWRSSKQWEAARQWQLRAWKIGLESLKKTVAAARKGRG